nr:MAG TPA: hypothetical protein [Caudoviricetes sp.]
MDSLGLSFVIPHFFSDFFPIQPPQIPQSQHPLLIRVFHTSDCQVDLFTCPCFFQPFPFQPANLSFHRYHIIRQIRLLAAFRHPVIYTGWEHLIRPEPLDLFQDLLLSPFTFPVSSQELLFLVVFCHLHRHRLPSYVSQFPLSSGVLVSDLRHFDPLHTHNRIQRIKYLSDVLRHLIRLSHSSVCCRITVSFMIHPHHSNLAFVRTTGNTADTFAPHRRSFGTRRLFHQPLLALILLANFQHMVCKCSNYTNLVLLLLLFGLTFFHLWVYVFRIYSTNEEFLSLRFFLSSWILIRLCLLRISDYQYTLLLDISFNSTPFHNFRNFWIIFDTIFFK